jgi:cytochrome b involved in lipid metabolism
MKKLSVAFLILCLYGCQSSVENEKLFVTEEPVSVIETENKTYSLSEVALHNSKEDCWTVIKGDVADVTAYFGQHPGGDKNLLKACGIDATKDFERVREHDPKGYEVFQNYIIGQLK